MVCQTLAKYQLLLACGGPATLKSGGLAAALVLAGAADAVTLTCLPAEGAAIKAADKPHAETLCAEALAYAKQNFALAGSAQPAQGAIDLTVLRANDRGAALAGVWRDAQGNTLAETELSAAFFDTSSSPALRETLIKAVFQQLAPQLISTAP